VPSAKETTVVPSALRRAPIRTGDTDLSPRQVAIIGLVARGQTNKAIAAQLGITERAVEATLSRSYRKLGVPNRAALIAHAMSEAGFGLPMAARLAPASSLGAVGTPLSLDAEARAYAGAPFMIAVTKGAEHRYSFINRAACEVAGMPWQLIVGRTVSELYPDMDKDFRSALDACYRTGGAWSPGRPVAVRWTRDDGSVRDTTVNLLIQGLRDRSGAVVGLLHIGAEVDAAADVGSGLVAV
jgi:DNA-binding CsgD family transcriptional regulator